MNYSKNSRFKVILTICLVIMAFGFLVFYAKESTGLVILSPEKTIAMTSEKEVALPIRNDEIKNLTLLIGGKKYFLKLSHLLDSPSIPFEISDDSGVLEYSDSALSELGDVEGVFLNGLFGAPDYVGKTIHKLSFAYTTLTPKWVVVKIKLLSYISPDGIWEPQESFPLSGEDQTLEINNGGVVKIFEFQNETEISDISLYVFVLANGKVSVGADENKIFYCPESTDFCSGGSGGQAGWNVIMIKGKQKELDISGKKINLIYQKLSGDKQKVTFKIKWLNP